MIEILIKKLEEKEQGIESNLNTYNNLLNELTDVYDSLEEIDINDYEETPVDNPVNVSSDGN